MGRTAANGSIETYHDRRGDGPEVLLIAGLGDPAEAWEFQLEGLSDRYTVTAFDNRGTGRVPLPAGEPLSLETYADDAAALMRALDVPGAHVMGFSMGSTIAQHLALRHPELVRSLVLCSTWGRSDAYFRAMADSWRWMIEGAPDERSFYEAFLVWVYTARAHEDGTVDEIINEAMAFPHQQPPEAMQRAIDAFRDHDLMDRLGEISTPTLVIASTEDIITPPRLGRAVAEQIPGARFELLEGEAHQPFQEVPGRFNALVDSFWREVDAGARR
jgi:pimeloyl-ACP methyl ester carboxylesterase